MQENNIQIIEQKQEPEIEIVDIDENMTSDIETEERSDENIREDDERNFQVNINNIQIIEETQEIKIEMNDIVEILCTTYTINQ